MATVDDIDSKLLVGKFLRRQTITPQADGQADTAEEINALLETVATTFLLYPQATLPIILRAKNSLRQIVQGDLSAVEFMLKALGDISNPDVPITDTSDLVEAQVALVELDRLGRVGQTVQAFDRYQRAIDRFLDEQLAPTLKRNARREFERTGPEAKQDLFSMLPQFSAAHGVMIQQLKNLQGSISDFRSVDLTKIVSTANISRVRSSLKKVRTRIESGTLSKTVAALELLSGKSSLLSISDTGDLFDPTIKTGEIPPRRTISGNSEDARATALSTEGPWTLGGGTWTFAGTMDPLSSVPQAFSFTIPGPGVSGRAYISSEVSSGTLNIPVNSTLYIHVVGGSSSEYEIALTSGPSVPIATLITDINTALGADGACIQNPGTFGFLIFGSSGVTRLSIRPVASGLGGVFNSNPSAHELLGFTTNQTSLPIGQFTADSLAAAIRNQLPSGVVSVEENKVRITSEFPSVRYSSLLFNDSAGIQDVFGFSGALEPLPAYIELVENGQALSPEDLGVFIGSVVTAVEDDVPPILGSNVRTLNNEPVTDIQGTKLFFAPEVTVPRGNLSRFVLTAPVVAAVQSLVQGLSAFLTSFDGDTSAVQRSLSPIASTPTRAQVNDAKRALSSVQTKLQNLLSVLDGITVRPERSEFNDVAEQVVFALEERGLDRAIDLLTTGQFSTFFSLDKETSAKSSRLLKAMELVGQNDLPVSFREVDIDDDQTHAGENPDTSVLTDFELEDEDTLVVDD